MKIIIYGYTLKSVNSYRFVHEGFFNAAKHLGYEVYWVPEGHGLDDSFFNNSFIICEGWEIQDLPVANNSVYIIHHFGNRLDMGTYQKNRKYIVNGNKVWDLRFMCRRMEDHNQKWNVDFNSMEKVNCCTYIDAADGYNLIYHPWATNLFPDEIIYEEVPRENTIYYIGQVISNATHPVIEDWKLDSSKRVEEFKRACKEKNIEFRIMRDIPTKECKGIIQRSFMAPDIRDYHKKEIGYVSCRVFKNISYGQLGITDVKEAYDLFEGAVAYHDDPYQLFHEGYRLRENKDMILHAMNLVRENHTYAHRLNTLIQICR